MRERTEWEHGADAGVPSLATVSSGHVKTERKRGNDSVAYAAEAMLSWNFS
jgi:hypothetical protein